MAASRRKGRLRVVSRSVEVMVDALPMVLRSIWTFGVTVFRLSSTT